ncbi:MAG: regulatory protein RecX [Deltaproteobacteria bacterium]|nr:regulatory protein RecX [Deltaproteobacteria bacterium]
MNMGKKRSRSSESAGESALRLLAIRDHSREEIRSKLQAKGFGAEEIERVLRDLVARGILDDFRYAQRLALSLTEEKLLGPQRIRQKLFQRGIPANLAQEAIEKAEETLAASERLQKVLRMKLQGRNLGQVLPKEKKQLVNYLRQRGFLWEDIWEAFQEAGALEEE